MAAEQSSQVSAFCRVAFDANGAPFFECQRGMLSVTRVVGQVAGAFVVTPDQTASGWSKSDCVQQTTPDTFSLTPAAGVKDAQGEFFVDVDGLTKIRVSCASGVESPYAGPALADVPFSINVRRVN